MDTNESYLHSGDVSKVSHLAYLHDFQEQSLSSCY